MTQFHLTDYQLRIVNQYLEKYPDMENVLLEKYKSFLVQELPATEFENIQDDINAYISQLSTRAKY